MGISGAKERKGHNDGPAANPRATSASGEQFPPAAWGPPELIYFGMPQGPAPGRAELTRLAFAVNGIEFKNVLHTFDEWPAVKADPNSPPAKCFGSMPVIVHGDIILAQSQATALYASLLRDASILSRPVHIGLDMMVVNAHADVQAKMYECLFPMQGDDERKAAAKEKLPDTVKPFLQGVERLLSKTEGAFLYATDAPTLGDLAIFDFVTSPFPGLKALGVDLSGYPKIEANVAATNADPYIAAYKAGAPNTDRRPDLKSPSGGAGSGETSNLYYFASDEEGKMPAPGRGEICRLAHVLAGKEYTDKSIPMKQWGGVKFDMSQPPAQCFGSIPVVENGPTIIAQSQAVALYASCLGGLSRAGIRNQKPANVGLDVMVLGAHADLQAAMYKCLFGDEAAKAAGKEALPGKVTPILEGLERLLSRHPGAFLYAKDGPTLGDVAIYDVVSSPFPGLRKLEVDLSPYPKILENVEATRADPAVESYTQKRGF